MKIGKTIRCQACGASQVIKHINKSMLECQYCGSMMAYTEDKNSDSQTKASRPWIMYLAISVLLIVAIVILGAGIFTIRQPDDDNAFSDLEHTELETNKVNKRSHFSPLAKQQNSTETTEPINQFLTVQSQVSGETSNGGKYWIFGVKNTGTKPMVRPGIMVSLFNAQGQRLVEQGGWSLQETLEVGQKTTVLVFLSKLPADIVEQQITPLASEPSQFGLREAKVKVLDYTVTIKNKQYEIIGDVLNNLENSVKYVRVIAVAYNATDEPIGIGNAFSTEKHLAPNQGSGFKIQVGTFLTGEPDFWQVLSLARED